jgi:hypothetical protein
MSFPRHRYNPPASSLDLQIYKWTLKGIYLKNTQLMDFEGYWKCYNPPASNLKNTQMDFEGYWKCHNPPASNLKNTQIIHQLQTSRIHKLTLKGIGNVTIHQLQTSRIHKLTLKGIGNVTIHQLQTSRIHKKNLEGYWPIRTQMDFEEYWKYQSTNTQMDFEGYWKCHNPPASNPDTRNIVSINHKEFSRSAIVE